MKIKRTFLCLSAFCAIMAGCSGFGRLDERDAFRLSNGGNARRGRQMIRAYGCYTCHTIDGVPGARGLIGPPLDGIGNRYYIAGELPNTPANLRAWIQHPHQFEPHTVMPEMNVTLEDSRDISAYLYTLR